MANQPTPNGIMKNRVRRMAARQGLAVTARRIKDPNAIGYGAVALTDEAGERVITAAGSSWETIEAYLKLPVAARPKTADELLQMMALI